VRTTSITIATLLLLSATLATAQTGNDLLQQALKKVYEDHDFESAIQIYDRILRDFSSVRPLADRATVARARAKELAARAEARKEYEDVIGKSPEQSAAVEEARRRLAELAFPNVQPAVYIADFDQQVGAIRGPVTRFTPDWEVAERYPSWSPDGKSIAMQRGARDGSATVVIREVATGNEIVFGRVLAGALPWFHDGGGLLAFSPTSSGDQVQDFCRELFRMDLRGDAQKLPCLPIRNSSTVALSPDQKTLYANVVSLIGENSVGTIVSIDLDTGKRKTAFALPISADLGLGTRIPINQAHTVLLSPDAKTVALHRPDRIAVIGVDGEGYRDLYRGNGKPIDNGAGDGLGGLAWTTDNRSLIFASLRPDGTDTYRIMRIPATGGEPKFTGLEVTGVRTIEVSPDGSRIAFDGTAYNLSQPGELTEAEKQK
jgi:hypothetical protein